MIRRAVLAGLTAALALSMGSAQAESPRWTIDEARSAITMRVTALGTARSGRFEDWSGDIRFDPEAPEKAQVRIDVRSASLAMRPSAIRDRAVGPAFLDAATYPAIGVRLRALEPSGPERYMARADVTLKGRTQAVRFPVDLRVEGDTAQMTGGFSLDRAAFDIGTRGPWNGLIGRQVRVDVSLATRRGG